MQRLFESYEEDSLISKSERKMLSGALTLKDKTAEEIMTPIAEVEMIDIDDRLD